MTNATLAGVLSAVLLGTLTGCGGGEVMPGVGPLEPDAEFHYDIRVPADFDFEEDYQLVIAFHDGGESERQVLDWWDRGLLESPDFILLAVRAPFLGEHGYNWLPRDANPGSDTDNVAAARTVEELVQKGLDAVTAEYTIDEEDIILVGTGSGTNVALWLALTDPGLYDGLALLDGRGIPGWVPGVRADNAGHLDVFVATDPATATVGEATAERLERAGARVEVHSAGPGRFDDAGALRAMEQFFSLSFGPATGEPDEPDSMPDEDYEP